MVIVLNGKVWKITFRLTLFDEHAVKTLFYEKLVNYFPKL